MRHKTPTRLPALALYLVLLAASVALAGCAQDMDPMEYVPPPRVTQETIPDGWPELRDARIRPGVQVFSDSGQCTGNFLFRTPDNKTLYMGIAAHCFMDEDGKSLPMGSTAAIGDVSFAGRLAWSLWTDGPDPIRDFALIELSNAAQVRDVVHPAVLHYGGPTTMADGGQVTTGEHVISYGHSGNRAGGDPRNPREGFVLRHAEGEYEVWTDEPGIPGDSGSGLMTADGKALGVLSRKMVLGAVEETLGQDKTPTVNFYVELDSLLDAARTAPGLEGLELVTWGTLEPPEIPLP